MSEALFITNRFGEKLETVISRPVDAEVRRLVILVAGFGADLHETAGSHDEIADRLAGAGLTAMQFSFAGRGLSEGNYEEMTIRRQADQIEDVIRWAQNTMGPRVIGIYAMSFGVPSLMFADPDGVVSLCLVSGSYFPREFISRRFAAKGMYDPNGISSRKTSSGEEIRVRRGFWTSLKDFDQIRYARKLRMPILMIHGDCDDKIPPGDAERVFREIPAINKTLKIFPGGDHGIIDVPRPMREEFLRDVVEWFRKTL